MQPRKQLPVASRHHHVVIDVRRRPVQHRTIQLAAEFEVGRVAGREDGENQSSAELNGRACSAQRSRLMLCCPLCEGGVAGHAPASCSCPRPRTTLACPSPRSTLPRPSPLGRLPCRALCDGGVAAHAPASCSCPRPRTTRCCPSPWLLLSFWPAPRRPRNHSRAREMLVPAPSNNACLSLGTPCLLRSALRAVSPSAAETTTNSRIAPSANTPTSARACPTTAAPRGRGQPRVASRSWGQAIHAPRRLQAVKFAIERGADQLGGLHGLSWRGAHAGDVQKLAGKAELGARRHRVAVIRALLRQCPAR